MQNKEFEDILASMEQIVRQAYTLGRSDALKQVVEVLNADPLSVKTLALPGPDHQSAASIATHEADGIAADDNAPASPPNLVEDNRGKATGTVDATPWFKRPPRNMR